MQCTLGTLLDQESATITIVVTADQAGDVLNTAEVSSDIADPNNNNNDDEVTVTVEAPALNILFLPFVAAN